MHYKVENICCCGIWQCTTSVWCNLNVHEAAPLQKLRNTSLEWFIVKYHNAICSGQTTFNTLSPETHTCANDLFVFITIDFCQQWFWRWLFLIGNIIINLFSIILYLNTQQNNFGYTGIRPVTTYVVPDYFCWKNCTNKSYCLLFIHKTTNYMFVYITKCKYSHLMVWRFSTNCWLCMWYDTDNFISKNQLHRVYFYVLQQERVRVRVIKLYSKSDNVNKQR